MAPINISEVLPNLLQSLTPTPTPTPTTTPSPSPPPTSSPSPSPPNIYTNSNHNANRHSCTFTVNNPTAHPLKRKPHSKQQLKSAGKRVLDMPINWHSDCNNCSYSSDFSEKEKSTLKTAQT
jgi:hypothetical protein